MNSRHDVALENVRIPAEDPFAVALLKESPGSEIVAKVGKKKVFLLRQWTLSQDEMTTLWDSIEYLDKKWRIPWRRRFRMALDKIWWRAVGWL